VSDDLPAPELAEIKQLDFETRARVFREYYQFRCNPIFQLLGASTDIYVSYNNLVESVLSSLLALDEHELKRPKVVRSLYKYFHIVMLYVCLYYA
jgi:hypothetical protein